MKHGKLCESDPYARDVCEGIYADKCDDVIKLHEALLAIYSLAGESPEIARICRDATIETGGEWDGHDRDRRASAQQDVPPIAYRVEFENGMVELWDAEGFDGRLPSFGETVTVLVAKESK